MWTAIGTRLPVQQGCVAELCISSPDRQILQCFQGWSVVRWLGREGSNLRMAESKSAGLFNDSNAHLEKRAELRPNNINSLAIVSK
jgi:hypothetical protein